MDAKILITGPPGCGKTTLIRELVLSVSPPMIGFITEEIRRDKIRSGFSIRTHGGWEGTLARIGLASSVRVGRYGVDIQCFENLLRKEFSRDRLDIARLAVIDEIGPMEWQSSFFRRLVFDFLEGTVPLVATISLRGPASLQSIKERSEVTLITLSHWSRNPGNRKLALNKITDMI